eukprot:g48522.t1
MSRPRSTAGWNKHRPRLAEAQSEQCGLALGGLQVRTDEPQNYPSSEPWSSMWAASPEQCGEEAPQQHMGNSSLSSVQAASPEQRPVKKGGEYASIYITGVEVERVATVKFLGVTITNNLFWTSHVDAMVKKAQQCLFSLTQLRKFGMPITTLTNFYRCTIESILSGCIIAWYGNCSAQECKKLQKVVCTAQTIMKDNLPSIDSVYTSRCCGNALNIIKDPSLH